MLCIIYVSGDIGGSVLGALTEELGLDDGMVFGMRFLPCMSVWSFMAQWCVCGFDMRWKTSTVCVGSVSCLL